MEPALRRFLKRKIRYRGHIEKVIGLPLRGKHAPLEPREKEYKISVLIVTRDRIDMLKRCVESLVSNAFDLAGVEFVLVFDRDDPTCAEFEEWLLEQEYDNFVILKTNRSQYFQRDYNNYGARLCRGKLIFGLNDECIIETNHWDRVIWSEYQKNKTPDDILLIGASDSGHDPDEPTKDFSGNFRTLETHGPCFPIITRTFFEVGGFFLPPEVNMWGADVSLYAFFQGIDRVHLIGRKVRIEHDSPHTKTRHKDQTALDVASISHKQRLHDDELQTYVETFKEYIESCND